MTQAVTPQIRISEGAEHQVEMGIARILEPIWMPARETKRRSVLRPERVMDAFLWSYIIHVVEQNISD